MSSQDPNLWRTADMCGRGNMLVAVYSILLVRGLCLWLYTAPCCWCAAPDVRRITSVLCFPSAHPPISPPTFHCSYVLFNVKFLYGWAGDIVKVLNKFSAAVVEV